MKKIWQEFHQELEKKPPASTEPNMLQGFWQSARQYKTRLLLGLLVFCLVLFLIWHLRAPQFPL